MELSIIDMVAVALNDRINMIFCGVITSFALIGIVLALIQKYESVRDFMPSLCSSLGVFGTFLGIFMGLYQFDTSHISESVPKLLDGMKLAFFTSLVGMLASYVLKFFYAVMSDQTGRVNDELSLLQSIEKASVEFSEKISQLDETLRKMFRADDDYSLVSQVKLIRQEIADSHKKTQETFEKMLDKFSEMASKSLVEQLRNVVEEFNVMLNELVAQSFKDLQASVDELNKWQSEYKSTIETNQENLKSILVQLTSLNAVYDSSIKKLAELESSMDSIDASLAGIGLSGSQLSNVSQRLEQQLAEMNAFLVAIKEVGDKASAVIPTLHEKASEVVNEISELQKTCTAFVEKTTNSIKEHESNLTQTVTNHVQKVQTTTEAALHAFETTGKNMQESLDRSIAEVTKNSENNIRRVEESLEKELTKSLESLAGALTQLSNKFVSDYLPLTERLRDVLKIAERASNNIAYTPSDRS